jgi:hypothetical protein
MDESIRQAWEESDPINSQFHGDIDADELRFHEATETLLVENDNHITTVLRAEYVGEEPSTAIDRLRSSEAQ